MIKFGTDGWRGIIAEDFTYENLRYVALAAADYLHEIVEDNRKPSAVIGYDARFMSKEFAEEVARVLAENEVNVSLTDKISTTPQVSYHTKQKKADLGFVITASHNPANYNGFKVKGSFGGPAIPSQVKDLETRLHEILKDEPTINIKSIDYYIENGSVKLFDAQQSYFRHIRKKIDLEAINKANYKIVYDPMYGAGIETIKNLLPNADEIHNEWNPGFGDIDHPEPIKECLGRLTETVKVGEYDIGLATDGDADRIGAIDEKGNFVDSHKIFMILLRYLYEQKKKKGSVVKTVSLTSMVDMYCEDKKLKLHETPVGFKHTAKIMNEENVLIGGEESGGLGTSIHIPERDGIFNGLLLLEVMAKRKMSLKELCDELDDQFGTHRYSRVDKRMSEEEKNRILAACEKLPKKLGRHEVESINTKDGYKFYIHNGWLLIRASGTEPLLRFYAEAETMTIVNELLDEGMKLG